MLYCIKLNGHEPAAYHSSEGLTNDPAFATKFTLLPDLHSFAHAKGIVDYVAEPVDGHSLATFADVLHRKVMRRCRRRQLTGAKS